MTKDDLINRYHEWLCGFVIDKNNSKRVRYDKLLAQLDMREFVSYIDNDENRAVDGVNLRYRFGHEHKFNEPMIASYLDDKPCSVLEMMIALALRCEEEIMDNTDIGVRTGQWFWNMIVNMDLGGMKDSSFDKDYANDKISIMLNRTYDRDGNGGLFRVTNVHQDMRRVEIWYQMSWYLTENYKQ